MKKIHTLLLLSFSLLCLREVRGVRCRSCTYAQGWKCMQGQGTCIAQKDESCSTISYFKGDKHLYSTHLCKYKCKEQYSTKDDLLRISMCCNKNLCNIF